jgi:hypothetical protein
MAPGRADLPMGGEWTEYRALVIAELTRINQTLEGIRQDLNLAKTDIALLQLKASVWGAISGAVVALGIIMMRYIT